MFHILLTVLRYVVCLLRIILRHIVLILRPEKTNLSNICRTRWVERVEGMDTFKLRIQGQYFSRDGNAIFVKSLHCHRKSKIDL